MKQSNNRRSFLKRAAVFSSTFFLGINTGFSKNKKPTESGVTEVEPLGFQWKSRDPFLFCVHHEDFFPKGTITMGPEAGELKGRQIGQDFIIKDGWRMYHGSKVPGFPSHPHRGFETVTVVRKGMVDHSDSLGGTGRYGDGDVQWMTAGKGVQHAEMFPLLNQKEDNPMELFQIWLNLPKASKFVAPRYEMLWSETIPTHTHKDTWGKKTTVEVIVGKIKKDTAPLPPPNSWAANSDNEVAIWNIHMEAGATWNLPKASVGINRTLYFFKGEILKVGGVAIDSYHCANLVPDDALTVEAGMEDCNILILQGKPIAEPVVQHGPFVMNTKAEIQQAFADYQNTQFGGWPWPSNSPVHSIEKGRFANHANGEVESKG